MIKARFVASFYAMKAVKDSGVPLKDSVRLILGLDEETNWKGMEHYLSKVSAPDYGFTPDGDFRRSTEKKEFSSLIWRKNSRRLRKRGWNFAA